MPTEAQIDRAVRNAEAENGYDESRCSADVGNNTKFGVWYGMNCAAWCAMAVSKWAHDAGWTMPASTAKGFAFTPSGAAWFQRKNAWAGPSANPRRGWVVFFYSDSAGRIAHVGYVRGPRGGDGLIPTVEGNTNGAGSAEGGSVLLKRRNPSQSLGFRIAGYGRPELLDDGGWWEVSIPETELERIEGSNVEALKSDAGKAAIRAAVWEALNYAPPEAIVAKGGSVAFRVSYLNPKLDDLKARLDALAKVVAAGAVDPAALQAILGPIVGDTVKEAIAANPISQQLSDDDINSIAAKTNDLFYQRMAP